MAEIYIHAWRKESSLKIHWEGNSRRYFAQLAEENVNAFGHAGACWRVLIIFSRQALLNSRHAYSCWYVFSQRRRELVACWNLDGDRAGHPHEQDMGCWLNPRLYRGSKVVLQSRRNWRICRDMAGNQIFIDQQKQNAFVKIQERLWDATLPPTDRFWSHPEVVVISTLETYVPAPIQAILHPFSPKDAPVATPINDCSWGWVGVHLWPRQLLTAFEFRK